MLIKEEIEKMIESAKETRERAFLIRTKHKIGASVLTKTGEVFGGCDIEGGTFSAGVCAEMAAINHAVVHGQSEIRAVTTVDEKPIFPCGACLQYMTQFYQMDKEEIEIVVSDLEGNYKIYTLSELLPNKWLSPSLDKKIHDEKNN
jgi:cytidine deaminase